MSVCDFNEIIIMIMDYILLVLACVSAAFWLATKHISTGHTSWSSSYIIGTNIILIVAFAVILIKNIT